MMPVFSLPRNRIWRRWLIVLPILILLVACSSENPQSPASATSLPPGDAGRGVELFTQAVKGAPSCNTCHTLDETTLVGPGMQGYGERAGSRVSGKSAEAYTLESIVRPAADIVPGFANVMYTNYAAALTPQDMADLMAYLLSL